MNFLANALFVLLLPSLGWSAPAQEESSLFDPAACAGFVALGFTIRNFDRYPVYFDDDSVLSVAQTGDYKGAESILEYVLFVDESSPHISGKLPTTTVFQGSILPNGQDSSLPFKFDPVNGLCTFTSIETTGAILDPALTRGGTIKYAYLANLQYSIPKNKIVKFDTYFPEAFLLEYFSRLQTPGVAEFICNVLTSQTCRETLGESNPEPDLTLSACVDRLSDLPLAEEGGYIDGNSFGCRTLHSVFAATNPVHCAHLSLIPTPDPNGTTKCALSAGLDPLALFSEGEISRLFRAAEADPDLDGDTGFAILAEAEAPATKSAKKGNKSIKSSKSSKSSSD